MRVSTLYPVRKAPRYAMSISTTTAAEGEPKISKELHELIGKFLLRIVESVGPQSRNPVEEIQDELALARVNYYSDVDFLLDLFSQNPIIGRTPLSSILPDPMPDDISLLKVIGSAVDRLLLRVASRWYKHEFGDAKDKKAAATDFYVYYDDIPYYVFGLVKAEDVAQLPYSSQDVLILTRNYLDTLSELTKEHPEADAAALLKQYPPSNKDVNPKELADVIGNEPSLAFANIGPILKEYKHGDVYAAARAALDSAVFVNAKEIIESGTWRPQAVDHDTEVDIHPPEGIDDVTDEEEGAERPSAEEGTKVEKPKSPSQSPSGPMPPHKLDQSSRPV